MGEGRQVRGKFAFGDSSEDQVSLLVGKCLDKASTKQEIESFLARFRIRDNAVQFFCR